MNIETLRHFFAWCAVINYGILLLWVFIYMFARGWASRLVEKWFGLPLEKFNSLNYAGISFYKLGIILFNLAPYLALRIIS